MSWLPNAVSLYVGFIETTTREPLICECGHTESDQPYDDAWEFYSLEGFEGHAAHFEGFCRDLTELLASRAPRCPHCGKIGKVRYANGP
jgi:hypothetical protein